MFIAANSRITSYFQASGSCLAGYIQIAGKCSISPGNISFGRNVSIHIHILVKLGISFGFCVTVKSSIPRSFKGAIHFGVFKGGVSLHIKVSGHIGVLKVRGAAYGQILAYIHIAFSSDITLQIRSTVHRLISIGSGIGIKSSISKDVKHIFQSSHTTNIQRAIDAAITFNRCIMLHGYITLEIRRSGYIQRTAEFTIRSGHITISYYISMRNYIAIRNDITASNNIRIT